MVVSHPDSAELERKFDSISLSVLSSSQISNRASLIIQHFVNDGQDNVKQRLCMIRAKAKVASKLISIVEIAKRDLKSKNIRIYQYSGLVSEMITIKPIPATEKDNGNAKDGATVPSVSEDEGIDAFETMTGKAKIRAVPVLTVYLSNHSIMELKTTYGEQTG